VSAQLELSRVELLSGRTSTSLQHAREAVKNDPANLAAQVALVRSLLGSKDIAGARRVLGPLLSEHPNEAALHVQRGYLASAANDLAEARRAFERALELNSRLVEAISGLAAAEIASRDFAAARARVEAAVKAQPDNPEVHLIAGRTYRASKDPVGAERELKRALELAPDLQSGYTMLGELYLSQGRLADARREFEALSTRQTKPVAALTMLGVIAQMEGDNARAVDCFERVVDLEPRAGIAANNLAWIYAERGEKLEYALQLAQTAVQAMPKAPEAHDTLGWVYYKRGTAPSSVSAFRQALTLAGENPTYHYHLGLAYQLAEDPANARQSLERALALGGRKAAWASDAQRHLTEIVSSPR
jgi:Flp pilus assembly protein TadD